jgi:hypothetical protein
MCLGDEVANHKMHGLNSSSREFTTIIHHKKYQERDPIVRDSKTFDPMSILPLITRM